MGTNHAMAAHPSLLYAGCHPQCESTDALWSQCLKNVVSILWKFVFII